MDMVHTFFWLHDDSVDAKCALEAGLIKGIILAVILTAAAFVPMLAVSEIAGDVALAEGEQVAAGTIIPKRPPPKVPWKGAHNIGHNVLTKGGGGVQNILTSIPTMVSSYHCQTHRYRSG